MSLIYLIAGEAERRRARRPADGRARWRDGRSSRFAGIGGEQMAAHGLTSLFPMRDLALMGLLEVLPQTHASAPPAA